MITLNENYNRLLIEEFWGGLDESLLSEMDGETDANLRLLLEEMNQMVLPKFGINPERRNYFIAGSAILYAYPKLKELFNLKRQIGDLDLVIPNIVFWKHADLEEEYNHDGIFRPYGNREIEVFTEWDPRRGGEEYENVNIRSTNEILTSAKKINGFYFMSIRDVINYKFKMTREKELEVNSLVLDYLLQKPTISKIFFLYKLAKIVGIVDAVGYIHATSQFSNDEINHVKHEVDKTNDEK